MGEQNRAKERSRSMIITKRAANPTIKCAEEDRCFVVYIKMTGWANTKFIPPAYRL